MAKPKKAQKYVATIQKATEPVARCNRPPTPIAAILHVLKNSDCSGSNHQFRGFLSIEGRRSFSTFHREMSWLRMHASSRSLKW